MSSTGGAPHSPVRGTPGGVQGDAGVEGVPRHPGRALAPGVGVSTARLAMAASLAAASLTPLWTVGATAGHPSALAGVFLTLLAAVHLAASHDAHR